MADTIPHGTYSGYQYHRCRCRPCTTANTRYARDRRRRRVYEQWNAHHRWDPKPGLAEARAHIVRLKAEGWTPAQVDLAAGVWEGCARRVLRDPEYRITRTTVERIRAVDPNPAGLPSKLAAGATNRLRCLAAIGHGVPWAAEQTGLTVRGLSYIRTGHRTRVSAHVHDAVVDLYREWSNTPAPAGPASARALWAASVNGWGPPAAWDEHWLDMGPAELAAELGREVARMDLAELARCYRSARDEGELSPLVVAAADAYPRRRAEQARGVYRERKVAA